jgi:hypothetical protein
MEGQRQDGNPERATVVKNYGCWKSNTTTLCIWTRSWEFRLSSNASSSGAVKGMPADNSQVVKPQSSAPLMSPRIDSTPRQFTLFPIVTAWYFCAILTNLSIDSPTFFSVLNVFLVTFFRVTCLSQTNLKFATLPILGVLPQTLNSPLFQPDSGAHPTSYPTVTGREANHWHPPSAEVKKNLALPPFPLTSP